jgi:hypothetical protein
MGYNELELVDLGLELSSMEQEFNTKKKAWKKIFQYFYIVQ